MMNTITLNNDIQMPMLGYGCMAFSVFQKILCYTQLNTGYR